MPPFKKLKTSENRKTVAKVASDSGSDNGENWRDDCYGIRDMNSYALRKGILTDVTFLVGAKLDTFHAHRLILALGSPVFQAMFYGPLAEKGDTITIPDIDPEGFHYLLKWIYTERTNFRDGIAAFKTAFAADKYCISYLKETCEHFLSYVELTTDNVWEFLQNSIYLNSHRIGEKCFEYLLYNLESALQHSSFLDINVRTVEAILRRNTLVIPEVRLLEAVVQWAHHNHNTEDKNSFKNVILPLLRHIRFTGLKAEEFIHYLEFKKLKEVLNTEDTLAILKHMLLPDLCSLPSWCCSKLLRRTVVKKTKIPTDLNRGFTVRRLLSMPSSVGAEYNTSSQGTSSSSSSSSSSASTSSDSDVTD